MIPEELNRTIEFITQSQARLAAAQEQDRLDRVEHEQWARNLIGRLARLSEENAQLLTHQSERMDRLDKMYGSWLKQNRDYQQQVLDLQRQALRLLNMILDRLPPFSPNPN